MEDILRMAFDQSDMNETIKRIGVVQYNILSH